MLMQAGGLITRDGGDPPRADPRKPGLRGAGADHRLAVRRAAADHAGRDRAGAPPYAIGAAFRHRGQRRLYRRRWRAHGDAARRFRHHARPGPGTITATRDTATRAASRWCGSTGSTSRSSGCSTPASPSPAPPTRSRSAARRRQPRPLRPQPAAGRLEAGRSRPRRCSTTPMRAPARRSTRLSRNGAPDPYHGHKLRYVNPATGEFAMPTIGTFIQLLPRGFAGLPYRSTDAPCMSASRARARRRIGDDGASLGAARHLCRAGLDEAHASCRRARRCCSASPTGRCRKNSGCGARRAATRNGDKAAYNAVTAATAGTIA